MINISDIIRQLTVNAEAIRVLIEGISDEQAQWKPDPETWSMHEVMEHVYNEERLDFRRHLKEMFSNPPQPWGDVPRSEYIHVASCRQALKDFLTEREASLAWLKGLAAPDWETASHPPFGPGGATVTLKAGDVFISWAEHDYLHMRQMIELLHAWNEKQGAPYSVRYGGGW